MKLLVIGNGGREHALAWKLAQSPKVETVFVAPGNAGTTIEPKLQNIALTAHQDLIEFCRKENIAFTVVGPEAPLAAGIVDDFRAAGLKIFGPTQYAAQLESSKDFAKAFMAKYNIPTAQYQTFENADAAHDYVNQKGAPIVIKADGLAAGKGVIVAMTLDEAHAAIDDMLLGNKMGNAGARVVIEDFLQGEESCVAYGDQPRSQASFRRRQRPEYGRYGRVQSRACGNARCVRARDERDYFADRSGYESGRA